MESLVALKKLQEHYQLKFAELIDLHDQNTNGFETPEYLQIRDEWIKTGNKIRELIDSLEFSK